MPRRQGLPHRADRQGRPHPREKKDLVLNWFRAGGAVSSGAVEGLNNKLKVIVRRSYGFRSYDVTSHDPIGDFVNAATSDVVDFLGRHDLASFKLHTDKLNDLATYRQLTARADQCGYRIGKVVYRGFEAPASLQQLLDQAIESRTRLQLERATQQQAQELEDFKLERQLARGDRQRSDGAAEQTHTLALQKARGAAELEAEAARAEAQRGRRRLDHECELADQRSRHDEQARHLTALRALGVELTAFLTQQRADQIIELRGDQPGTQLHLDGPRREPR